MQLQGHAAVRFFKTCNPVNERRCSVKYVLLLIACLSLAVNSGCEHTGLSGVNAGEGRITHSNLSVRDRCGEMYPKVVEAVENYYGDKFAVVPQLAVIEDISDAGGACYYSGSKNVVFNVTQVISSSTDAQLIRLLAETLSLAHMTDKGRVMAFEPGTSVDSKTLDAIAFHRSLCMTQHCVCALRAVAVALIPANSTHAI